MPTKQKLLALVALLLCSACADQTATKHADATQSLQMSAIRWEEATAATTMAKVSNSNLIAMR